MSKQLTYPGDSADYRLQETQLIMSLKFHHSETIAEIPLEVALAVMGKVWLSCHGEASQGESIQWNEGTIF